MSWWRLMLGVSRPALGGLLLAVVAGVGAAGAGVGLTATAAWLISRAALHPPVLHLMVAIVAVRAFGISRGVLRYLKRLAGHDAALRVLGEVRVRLFTRLDRLAPAGLADFRRADLVQRMAGRRGDHPRPAGRQPRPDSPADHAPHHRPGRSG
jgi:ABC-type transport system involved in cytochrome bd biosynthesis fused ATPase/permease subunit